MDGLILKVITWAEDSNMLRGSDLKTEVLKLTAEYGELISCLNQNGDCRDGIGKCVIQMVIICRMRNINLNDCVINAEAITDKRIVNRRFVMMTATQYLGGLNRNILMREDIKANMGYLFIYLAALARVFNYSVLDCLEVAYNNLLEKKGIMFDGSFIEETDEKYQTAVSILKSKKTDD
ncbi:hypothetical protein [Nitrosomonas sp. Nm166]|uniref:hypothetical protein n=1 Tax=Nitrosomonas sp. Nm166 TaxID=1881054 RepID=UPI0008E59DCB|nr:hypothetical protein [Nitrosomonas sp. Nm166]SFE11178.1 hypothetical protein SAMN05428977_10078 [Nitrosomonas sp. Nm166]